MAGSNQSDQDFEETVFNESDLSDESAEEDEDCSENGLAVLNVSKLSLSVLL